MEREREKESNVIRNWVEREGPKKGTIVREKGKV
jgi:hypothetical protein